jgi:hypothetical protein
MSETVRHADLTSIKTTLEKHDASDEDRFRRIDERFGRVDASINEMRREIDNFRGAVSLLKWELTIGLPIIIAMLGWILGTKH